MRVCRAALISLACACQTKEVAEESCSGETIDSHAELSFVDPEGLPVESFAGTATPEGGEALDFACPGDEDCVEDGVLLWTEAPSVVLEVATPDGALAFRDAVTLRYVDAFCGDDGHCVIECPLAAVVVTLSPP